MTEKELIKKEIKRIHKRGSSDFTLLMRQVDQHYKKLNYNMMQFLGSIAFENPKLRDINFECGRGAGKTTLLGHAVRKAVYEMPRAKGIMLGVTFKAMDEYSLPSLKTALENQGLFEDLHYFAGKRPPKKWNWDKPHEAPKNYDRMWTFFTGTGLQMFSMEGSGEGRGPNTHFRLADEFALLDGSKVNNIDITVRAKQLDGFTKSDMYLKKIATSTTPLDHHGAHFLEREEAAKKYPDSNFFMSSSWKVNKNNLPEDYAIQARRNALFEWMYLAEYENVRPTKIQNAFYALLNKNKHTYTASYDYNYIKKSEKTNCLADADRRDDTPLILGIDWGSNINCLVVLQENGRELRAINEFYAKAEDYKIQDDMIEDFLDYYMPHSNKIIYMYYDNTGNNQTGNTRLTRAAQAAAQLRISGWRVQPASIGGRNPLHYEKYLTWEAVLKEEDKRFPRFRLNKDNCPNLWISMTNTKAKIGSDKSIRKDKSSENSTKIKREHATDFGDAIDAPIYAKFFRFTRQLSNSTTIPSNC